VVHSKVLGCSFALIPNYLLLPKPKIRLTLLAAPSSDSSTPEAERFWTVCRRLFLSRRLFRIAAAISFCEYPSSSSINSRWSRVRISLSGLFLGPFLDSNSSNMIHFCSLYLQPMEIDAPEVQLTDHKNGIRKRMKPPF
jgi:hypothetical protein